MVTGGPRPGPRTRQRRVGGAWARPGRGQALVETALAFPILVLAAYAMVQIVLYVHARTVVRGAIQDGARVAAVHTSPSPGVSRAQGLIRAGLGPSAGSVGVTGRLEPDAAGLESYVFRAEGSWAVAFGPVRAELPLGAETRVSGEFFRGGPPERGPRPDPE